MRRITKKSGEGNCHEGVGYEMSIGDLMAGLLFIFIIVLMVFVFNFQEQAKKDLDYLNQSRMLRTAMLEDIKSRLNKEGIEVEVDTEHGIIHLTENAIQFESGRSSLDNSEQRKLAKIAGVLATVLPPFAAPIDSISTENKHSSKLESVFIEGHTDNVPYRNAGQFRDNWDLSALRAIYVYRQFIAYQPILAMLKNSEAFPLFSISGYGESRPRNRHDSPYADSANRRIDLRVIMAPPRQDLPIIQSLQGQGI